MTELKRYYTCVQGDTWDTAALYVYGDERYAAWLLRHNPGVTELYGGLMIYAPETEETGISDDAPWRR